MKRIALVFLFLFALLNPAWSTDKYWVGGSGNWSDNTNHWAATSGGAPGAALPNTGDNVIFDTLSHTAGYTVTMDQPSNCLDMTWGLPLTGVPTVTVGVGGSLSIFGSLTMVAGMLTTGTNAWTFASTSTGKTITTAGVSLSMSWNFNGTGGGWTLADALTISSSRILTVINGTLNTNAQTVSTGFFVSTSGTRTLTLTNSTINVTGATGAPWNVSATGLTYTTTGTIINVIGGTAAGNLTLTFPTALNTGTVNITGAGLWTITSVSATYANFSYTSTANKTDALIWGSVPTIVAGGTFVIAGNSTVNRAFVRSSVLGSSRAITVSGGTTPSLTNVDFQDITASGNTPWTGTSLGDALGNSGITFDGSTTQTYTGDGVPRNWTTTARWTSRVPLPQDDVVIGSAANTTSTITADMPRLGRNIDFTGFTQITSFASTPNTIYGNITLATGATYSGTQAMTFAGRGSHTITNNGKTFPQSMTFAAFGGSYTTQDAMIIGTAGNGFFTFSAGTFDSGANDVTFLSFSGTSGEIKATSLSTWYATRTTATPFSGSTVTLTSFFATINYTAGGGSNLTFAGVGKTYGNFFWSGTAGTGASLTITGANTFADFKVDGTTARTVTFPASAVTTVNTLTKSNPTAGVLTTINSSTPGTRATLQSRGPRQSNRFLSVIDINAVGGAGWFAGNKSTNGGNNYGWQFRPPAPVGAIRRQY